MSEVKIYKTTRCAYCSMAIRFLEEVKKVSPIVIDITNDSEARTKLYLDTGSGTVPKIFVGEVHMGG